MPRPPRRQSLRRRDSAKRRSAIPDHDPAPAYSEKLTDGGQPTSQGGPAGLAGDDNGPQPSRKYYHPAGETEGGSAAASGAGAAGAQPPDNLPTSPGAVNGADHANDGEKTKEPKKARKSKLFGGLFGKDKAKGSSS